MKKSDMSPEKLDGFILGVGTITADLEREVAKMQLRKKARVEKNKELGLSPPEDEPGVIHLSEKIDAFELLIYRYKIWIDENAPVKPSKV